MTKILFVSSAVQAVLMTQVYIHELKYGFWKTQRPLGHGDIWQDVEIKVADSGVDAMLGCLGFITPRPYNFLNLEFYDKNEARMLAIAGTVRPGVKSGLIKKELVELGKIVRGSMPTREAIALPLNRGNHKPGTVTVPQASLRLGTVPAFTTSSEQARSAGAALQASAAMMKNDKKTVVRRKDKDALPADTDGVVYSRSTSGALVKRVACQITKEVNV